MASLPVTRGAPSPGTPVSTLRNNTYRRDLNPEFAPSTLGTAARAPTARELSMLSPPRARPTGVMQSPPRATASMQSPPRPNPGMLSPPRERPLTSLRPTMLSPPRERPLTSLTSPQTSMLTSPRLNPSLRPDLGVSPPRPSMMMREAQPTIQELIIQRDNLERQVAQTRATGRNVSLTTLSELDAAQKRLRAAQEQERRAVVNTDEQLLAKYRRDFATKDAAYLAKLQHGLEVSIKEISANQTGLDAETRAGLAAAVHNMRLQLQAVRAVIPNTTTDAEQRRKLEQLRKRRIELDVKLVDPTLDDAVRDDIIQQLDATTAELKALTTSMGARAV